MKFRASAWVLVVLLVAGCEGGGGSGASPISNNPVPTISSITPSTMTTGSAALTLTVNGTNFVSSSAVQWNGRTLTTTYQSATQLTASTTAADIASSATVPVTVVNPTPGGGASTAVNLSISNVLPAVTSISPVAATVGGPVGAPTLSSVSTTSVAAGSAPFTLTVNGSNYTPGSVVQWNGTNQVTTYVSSTQLTASITAPDIAVAGTATVTVANMAPGGGTSTVGQVTVTGTLSANASFVATTGSDTNPGGFSQPYLTIQKCASTVVSGWTCYVRAGSYYEMVTPNSGITISSYDGETVTVDGTNAITGWTLYKGSIYAASVTLSPGDTNQVFANGQMMTEARWPNGNDLFHVNWATAQAGTVDSAGLLVDSNLPNINWTGARIHLWSGTDPWEPQTGVVTTSQSGQLTYMPDGASYCPYICAQSGGYYYLFGILGALDTQREWVYVSGSNTLYFWAPGGVNPATLSVRAKQRQYAFDLSGTSNVTIEYINLFASTINTSASSTNNTINSINAQFLSHFTSLPDVTGRPSPSYWYDHLNDTGVILNGSGNTLENSTIAYSAGNGVALLGSNNTVKNNLIDHVDYVADYASGIALSGTNAEIQDNTIYAAGRFAIFPSYNAGSGNDISYNNFFSAMMLSRDGGEIYISYPGPTGMAIHNNWLHDTQSLISGPADDYALAGIYLDEDADGYIVDQNVLWNNEVYNIFLNGSNMGTTVANNNNIHNNTIPDVGSAAGIVSGPLITNCGTTQFVDNLVLLPVNQAATPPCSARDNNSTAPGASTMTASVQVGCNFSGCASEGPPAISGTSVAASIALQPYGVTVAAGQTATFSVTGAGSAPLTYQWQKNGVNISGAAATKYTTPATAAADSGAVFTVEVTNSLGTVTSDASTLTVD